MRRIVFVAALVVAVSWVPSARAQFFGDPNDIVFHWYRAFLRRDPDPAGARFWANRLRRGNDPNTVLAGILGSEEYYQRAGSRPDRFVVQLFVDLLGRTPTQREIDFWVRRQFTDSRQDVAFQVLSQNPGAWVGSFRLPVRDRDRWYRDRDHERERAEMLRRERERQLDWEWDRFDVRRPTFPFIRP